MPVKAGGYGVLKLHTVNLALLTKRASRIMSSDEDLAILALKEYYGTWLNR